jgi:hypothetical protein
MDTTHVKQTLDTLRAAAHELSAISQYRESAQALVRAADAMQAALDDAPIVKLVNCTPHPINLVTDEGEIVIPPSGDVARVSCSFAQIATLTVEGLAVPLLTSNPCEGGLQGLPQPQSNTMYVVSAATAAEAKLSGRHDCVSPAELVRDSEGKIVGCKSLLLP